MYCTWKDGCDGRGGENDVGRREEGSSVSSERLGLGSEDPTPATLRTGDWLAPQWALEVGGECRQLVSVRNPRRRISCCSRKDAFSY